MPGSGADLDHVVAVTGLDDVGTAADVDVIVSAQAADDVVRAGRVEIVGAGGPHDRATVGAALRWRRRGRRRRRGRGRRWRRRRRWRLIGRRQTLSAERDVHLPLEVHEERAGRICADRALVHIDHRHELRAGIGERAEGDCHPVVGRDGAVPHPREARGRLRDVLLPRGDDAAGAGAVEEHVDPARRGALRRHLLGVDGGRPGRCDDQKRQHREQRCRRRSEPEGEVRLSSHEATQWYADADDRHAARR